MITPKQILLALTCSLGDRVLILIPNSLVLGLTTEKILLEQISALPIGIAKATTTVRFLLESKLNRPNIRHLVTPSGIAGSNTYPLF